MNQPPTADGLEDERTIVLDGFLMIAAIAGSPSYLTQTVYPDLVKIKLVRDIRAHLVKRLCGAQENAAKARSEISKAEWHLYSVALKATIRLIDYQGTTGKFPEIADKFVESMTETVFLDARARAIEKLMEGWRVNDGE
jgi:hypothetical protein